MSEIAQELNSRPSGLESNSWQPILDGALAEHAFEAVLAVAAGLRTEFLDRIEHATLAGGDAGLALLYAYLEEAEFGESNAETALVFLRRAIDRLASSPMAPSLYAGFAGIAWTVEHLKGRLLDPEEHGSNGNVDEVLREYLGRSPWTDQYDLVSGLVGFGVYALESLPRPVAVQCVERIIDRLDETAERTPDGITWRTDLHLLPERQRELFPHGCYNLGLAHGVPGVIAFLGQVTASAVSNAPPALSIQSISKARSLSGGAVQWLMAQRLPAGSGSCFGSLVAPGLKQEAARLAWCYGDPGIAAALLVAARGAGKPSWERMAVEIARLAAERAPETSRVVDAGLCHGAAGVGHLFNRMYQSTGETLFKEAATFWLERALEMRRAEGGVGGFFAPRIVDGKAGWVADPGLLNGAAGIALAFLSAIAPVEPAWDRMLLVSIPLRSTQW